MRDQVGGRGGGTAAQDRANGPQPHSDIEAARQWSKHGCPKPSNSWTRHESPSMSPSVRYPDWQSEYQSLVLAPFNVLCALPVGSPRERAGSSKSTEE